MQRGRVDRGVVGEVDHILADRDQIAADRQVVNGTAIVLGVDDRRRLGGKTRQILVDRKPGDVGVDRQERLQRHRRREFVGADKSTGQLENALMDRFEEMLRFEEVGNAVERLVIDEDRAEQRLLGLDIVRRRTERRFRRSLLACGRIECWHGPDQGIGVWRFLGRSTGSRDATSRITQRQRHFQRITPSFAFPACGGGKGGGIDERLVDSRAAP